MNIRQLSYFRGVVDHGSLATAAEVLHVAQPNLSVAIRQLETEWGVILFDRVGRRLTLTETGRLLYERASQLLSNATALDQEMRAVSRGFSVRLRVGFTAVAMDVVTAMVARMSGREDVVNFSLRQGEPQLLETMVELRQLDFAITHFPVANASLHVQPLSPLRLMLVGRADDTRWIDRPAVNLGDLANVPLILLRRSSGTGVYERIVGAFTEADVPCNIAADCSDPATIYQLIQQDVGVGLLPSYGTQPLGSGYLVRPVSFASWIDRLALIYPRGRKLLPVTQKAIQLCRSIIASDGTAAR